MLLAQDPKLLLVDEPVAGMTDARDRRDGKAAQGHRQDPLGGGGRARHELRARPRHARDVPRRRLGAGRRHARPGERQPGGDRKVSRTMSVDASAIKTVDLYYGAAQALLRHHHRVPGPAGSPPCSAATASARARRCAPSPASTTSPRARSSSTTTC